MKLKWIPVILIALLISQTILTCAFNLSGSTHAQMTPDVYVGVDLAYGDVTEAKALIDQVGNYTNLIVVGTSKITWNPSALNETFQYAFDRGLYFMGLTPSIPISTYNGSFANRTEWFKYANETWGDHLLGFYQDDEPGGKQIDVDDTQIVRSATSLADASSQYESRINQTLTQTRVQRLNSTGYPLYTSDYALYWFDYKGGYDGLFAEFGWNYTSQLTVALCRGAANVQNKEWGVMITWTYRQPPYIESGTNLFNDMVLAYDNGAKYIIIFDANEGWTAGILQDEHLQAMQQFWQYIQNHPRKTVPLNQRTAYVLPKDYGYGFRGPIDKVWGLWPGDDFSYYLSLSISELLREYGEKLDIIYDDGLEPGLNYGYSQLISWDSYNPTPTTTPTPTPSPAPTSTPTATPTPTDPSTDPPTPTPSSSSSPTIEPTATQKQSGFLGTNLPLEYGYAIVATVVIVGVLAATAIAIRRRKKVQV